MPRASQRGNDRENRVAALLRAEGWVVGSMRQSLGGGDLLASRVREQNPRDPIAYAAAEVRLVEVKSTAGGPYERFGSVDRASMREYAERAGASAWLAWWPPRGVLEWIPSSEWPS